MVGALRSRPRRCRASAPIGCASLRVVQREVALGPDLRRVRLERLFRIEHERQHLVVDRDQPQRFFGDVAIDGRDRRDRLADEAHRVVERVAPLLGDLLDLVVVLLAAGDRPGAPDDLAVLVRDDRLHAGQRARLRRVDATDARVRMRAAQHARVEHARQLDVAGVGRLAGDALDGVDARRRVADDGHQRRSLNRRRSALLCWLIARLPRCASCRGARGHDRLDVAVVVGAAADVAGQRRAHLLGGRVRDSR